MHISNQLLFIALPYVAIVLFLIGSIWRYRATGFKVSSLSSQFLEGQSLYLGTMAFHWGILIVFAGHLTLFLFPQAAIAWNSSPVRLIVHEVVAFIFGLSILIGLILLIVRRLTHPRIRQVTSRMDLVAELLLLLQIILGCWTALGYRWGTSWFAADLTPYLRSIVTLHPRIEAVSAMPWVIKAHVVGAFVIIGLIPFTRLMHFLVAPFHYIWRRYQLAIWCWDRKRIRDPHEVWTQHYPRNN